MRSDAHQVLERSSIDVVALDLGLPDAQGLHAVAGVRGLAPHLPIVLKGLSDEAAGIDAVRDAAEDDVLRGQAGRHRLSSVLLCAITRKQGEEQTLATLALLS
jgi:DNA-binding response OmpR family regulator